MIWSISPLNENIQSLCFEGKNESSDIFSIN